MRDRGDLGDRLDRACFVVGVHHGDENRIRPQGAANVFGVDDAIRTGRDEGILDARWIQLPAGIEHGGMLDLARDHVLFEGRDFGADRAHDGQVVRLRSAAGEDQLLGLAAEQSSHFAARGFQTLFRQLTVLMDAGGIAGHFK